MAILPANMRHGEGLAGIVGAGWVKRPVLLQPQRFSTEGLYWLAGKTDVPMQKEGKILERLGILQTA